MSSKTKNVIALCFVVCGCLGIKLVDHKYEDVYIAIQKTVMEDPRLIERIQKAFTAASALLFKATHNRVYFGKISILIPKNWNSIIEAKSVSSVSTPNYIEVSEGLGTAPSTRSTVCGHEGVSMYIPPKFFTEDTEKHGRKENVIVHEWGQFRWGLFPEYPEPKRRFYLHDGRWNPSMCSKHITGKVTDKLCTGPSSPSCDLSKTDVLPPKCKFCPDKSGAQKANASILSYQYVSSLAFFCDKDDPSVPVWQRHNPNAYTKQNDRCDHKSAWEVMRKHSDFQSDAQLPDDTNTTPKFEVLRETDAIRVFVFDVSGSMNTGGRIGQLHKTGSYIINETLPLGSWLGIVWFNEDADEYAPITQINNDSDRQSLVGGIPDSADGDTCIGCGLHVALEMLKTKFGTAENAEIILMSDGQDNYQKKLEEATLNAKQAKVTIHTVSISQEADQRMIDLAISTGGKYFTYLDKGILSFEAVFSEAISSGLTEQSTKDVTLTAGRIPFDTNLFNFPPVTVDGDSGSLTSISVLSKLSAKENITMVIMGPLPERKTYEMVKEDVSFTYTTNLQPGEYTVTVTSITPTQWDYKVKTKSTGSHQLTIKTQIFPKGLDVNKDPNLIPKVFADVTKGNAPVVNVDVFALLDRADAAVCNLTLKDDGLDPDAVANDGRYSAYIPFKCLNNGRVNMQVQTFGIGGRAQVVNGLPGAIDIEEPEIEINVIGNNFQRLSIPEPLFVENLPPKEDIDLPPGRITDLSVVDIKTMKSKHGESRNFTIAWTATGSDLNVGQASSYDIRIAGDIDTILHNFSNAQRFDTGNGKISPKPSGSTEAIRIVVNADQSYTGTAFLAIVAMDEHNNTGKVSNVVSIVVAKGFRIEVEEVANYKKGMFDDELDLVDKESKKTTTRPVNDQPPLVASAFNVVCLTILLYI